MQQAKLKELKQNDIQEMKMIAEKFGNNGEIFEVFENIIERRYEKLNKFFEDHIESMKLSISTPEMTLKKESPDLDSIFNAINSKDLKQTSGQLWDDIEKIWQQIENFEENSSFLQDPQPLPPLTPIYQGKNEFGKIAQLEFVANLASPMSKVYAPSSLRVSVGKGQSLDRLDFGNATTVLTMLTI